MYEVIVSNEKEFKLEIQKIVDTHAQPRDILICIARARYGSSLNAHRAIPTQSMADELFEFEKEMVSEEKRWKGEIWYYV